MSETEQPVSDAQLWSDLEAAEGSDRAYLLHELSHRAFVRAEYEQSATLSMAAAEAAEAASNTELHAHALFGHAQGLSHLDRTDDAVQAFLAAADVYRTCADDPAIAQCHFGAGLALFHGDRNSEAIGQLASAQHLLDPSKEADEFGRCAMARGDALGRLGRPQEALAAFAEARAAFRRAGQASDTAWADDRSAAMLQELGETTEAVRLLEACVHVVGVDNDPRAKAWAEFRLGIGLRLDGRAEASIERIDQARVQYLELGDVAAVARCDREASVGLGILDRDDEADERLVRARAVFDAVGDDASTLGCDLDRALLLSSQRREDEAIPIYRRIRQEAQDREDMVLHTIVTNRLATDLLDTGRWDEVGDLLDGDDDERFADTSEAPGAEHIRRVTLQARVALAERDLARACALADRGLAMVESTELQLLHADLLAVRCQANPDGSRAVEDRARAVALYLESGNLVEAAGLARAFLPAVR